MTFSYRFLFILAALAGLRSYSQCSYTAAVSINGPAAGCGNRVLTISPVSDTWTQKASFTGTGRMDAVGFSIGNKGYIGTGETSGTVFLKDFWEYDPATDAWTQKADFAGGTRRGAVGFGIGSKGYVGTGYGNGVYKSDFWEYDPATNLWTQKANMGTIGREQAVGFSINNKGYIGTGVAYPTYYRDFYEYDPTTDTWIGKASVGFNLRANAFAFAVGSKGYICGGSNSNTNYYNDLLEFDPATGNWTARASIGTIPISVAAAFTIGNKGFVATGSEAGGLSLSDRVWQYDPANNSWTSVTRLGTANRRSAAVGFAIGNKGYVGTGGTFPGFTNSFWEYDPGVSVAWSTGATTPTLNVTASGNYSALLTTVDGCTATVSQSLMLTPAPAITISGAAVACSSANNTLTATGATSYSWSANAGGSTSNSVVVSATATTVYTVSGTTGTCTVDKTFMVINASPTLTLFTPSLTACGTATIDTKAAWDVWYKKENMSATGRANGVAFSIGNRGYIGTGSKSSATFNDFWEYNPDDDTWMQKADVPGGKRSSAVGFAIGDKGYVGTGYDQPANTVKNDFWEYDAVNNNWVQKAPMGAGRDEAVAFVIGNKAYVGTGYGPTFATLNDLWEYDPATDTWTQKTSMPGTGRIGAISFAIGNKGYVGIGSSGSALLTSFYEYNSITNAWTQKANYGFTGWAMQNATGFSIGNLGYAGTGFTGFGNIGDNAIFQYNPLNDTWNPVANFPWNFSGEHRDGAVAFVIGARVFMGTGNRHTSPIYETNDLFEYVPGMSVLWSNGSTATVINPTVSGVYTATLTNILGCTAIASQSVTILPYPVLSVSNPSAICSGQTATVSVSGANSYTWSSNAGGSNLSSLSVNPLVSTIYTVTGKTAICSSTAGARLLVYATPTVAIAVNGPTTGCGTPTLSVSQPGNGWSYTSSFTGAGRELAVAFTINNKAYMGAGYAAPTFYQDFWEFDPITGAWSQKANFTGGGRRAATGFSIGNKGYLGTGHGSAGYFNDFWEFNPANNTWTQKASVGSVLRYACTGFSINGKGYIGLGANNTSNVITMLNDLWEYDPAADTWTQRTNLPAVGRNMAACFVIGAKGYIATGQISPGLSTELWEYTPLNDTWVQKNDLPGAGRMSSAAFSIGNKGYLGIGQNGGPVNTFWEYTPATDAWSQIATFAGSLRSNAVAFNIGNKGYLGLGYSPGTPHFPADLWQYEPQGTIAWSTGSGSASIQPIGTGPVSVTLTSAAGCSASGSQLINVSPNPTLAVSGPGVLCAGSIQTLTASGADTYTWSANAGSGNTNTVTVQPFVATVYTLSGSTGSCTLSYTVPVTVNPLPTVAINSGTICAGNTFTIAPTGAASYSYLNGGPVVSPTTTASYSVNGISALGCVSYTPAVATVSVTSDPLPSISANSGSVCAGQSFSLNPSGASTYTYSNGGGAVVTPAANTSYSVTGTSSAGCISTVAVVASVTVVAIPTLAVNNGTICEGASFTIVPSGAFTYSITGNNFIVNPLITTTYTVTGNSTQGCFSNAVSATVTVNSAPVINVNSGTICSGQSFVILPSGADTYTINGNNFTVSPATTTGYSVTGTSTAGCVSLGSAVSSVSVNLTPTVSVNNGTICSGTAFTIMPAGATTYTISGNSFTVSPLLNTSYSVTGTAANGCISSNTAIASVSVNTTPTVSVNSGSICAGQVFTFNPSGALTYTISNPGTTTVSPGITTSYSVTGSSAEGCISAVAPATVTVHALPLISVNSGSLCTGHSFVIVPSGAASYTISGGTFTVSPSATTSYSVTGTSAQGCVSGNTAVAGVAVYATPVVSVNSGSICSGAVFNITPSGAASYTISGNTFSVSPAVTTSYSVTGSSTAGCVSLPAVSTVTIHTTPSVSVNSGSVCYGNSFVITPSGAGVYTITGNNYTVSPLTTSTYSVNGNSAEGCTSAVAISTVTVVQLPDVTATSSSPVLCIGETAVLTASGAGSYVWNTTETGISISVTPGTITVYTVTGANAAGCVKTATVIQVTDLCTGIQKQGTTIAAVNVYPNPNNGTFIIEAPEHTQVTIVNAIGQLMLSKKMTGPKQEFILNNLANGIYFVTLQQQGKQQVVKIVKE